MIPNPRYLALNDAMTSLRGEAYELHIKGIDELRIRHDSVMVEACNSSFQVHLQVTPDEFANLYNLAQVLAGPVLAAPPTRRCCSASGCGPRRASRCSSSRSTPAGPATTCATRSARVTFGNGWVDDSVLEIFREDIARFRPLVGTDVDEDPLAVLDGGPGARAQGAAPAQRHGLPLEPRLLRHHRRQAAPAHREPRAAVGAERRRRGRQRRVLVRA